MNAGAPDPVTAPDRLAAVRATGLSAASDEVLDGYCRLVARLLAVPIALVGLVDADRELLPGVLGLGGEAEALREVPLSHALARTVVATGAPYVVDDAAARPELRGHPAATALGVAAYLGAPLVADDGAVVGVLAAADRAPRAWSDPDIATVADLARAVGSELRLRSATGRARQLLAANALAASRAKLVADVSDALVRVLDPMAGLSALARAVVPALADLAVVHGVVDDAIWRVDVVHRALEIPDDARRRRMPELEEGGNPLGRVLRGLAPLIRVSGDELAALAAADEFGATQARLLDALGADHLLVIGLEARGTVRGALTLGRSGSWGFTAEDEQTAGDIARRAALAIDNARLYAEQRTAAETLQAGLTSRLPDLADGELAARYVPAAEAAEVGGDWYDAFHLPIAESGNLVIGDVVGHDLAAATQMGQLRNLLRALAVDRVELPAKLITRLDRLLSMLGEEVMATLVVGRVDRTDAGAVRFTWSNAGHPPPVVVLPTGEARLLDADDAGGPMLGVVPTAERGTGTVLLPSGSTLLLYTDGLVERRDQAIDERLDELRGVVGDHGTAPLGTLLDEVVRRMVGTAHDDDVALLAFRPH